MFKIEELHDKYNISLGFGRERVTTETEKLMGTRMHLVHNIKSKRDYQGFWLNDKEFDTILNIIKENRANGENVSRIGNDNITFEVIERDDTIYGVCIETHERVCFERPLHIVIGD